MTDRKKLREAAMAAAACDDTGGVWAYVHWAEKSNDSGVVTAVDENDVPVSGHIDNDPDRFTHLDTIAACDDDLSGGLRARYIALANPAAILSLLDDLDRPVGEMVAWQWSDAGGKWFTIITALDDLAEQERLARETAARHLGRVRPLYLAPSPAIGRDDEERVRGEDWENAAHDLLWETGRRDEFEALREKADENARERSQP